MWRSNYHEDWELRKTYLIRSLFQDIPALSTVPEDEESRFGAESPSDIPLSRPYSPLPQLIIERMPNRHDHPKKFYQDLEIKMKKLYKKLFLNKGSSSIEDLIEAYGDDYDALSLIDQSEEYCHDISGGNTNDPKEMFVENISQSYSSSERVSPGQTTSDKNVNKSLYDGLAPSSKASSLISSQANCGQTSTKSLGPTQVTTVVEIHKEPSSDRDETFRSLQDNIHTSPVLECQRISYNKTSAQIEMCQEKEHQEHKDKDGMNETDRTETSGSAKEGELNEEEEELDHINSSETSRKSIEVMRRQKKISLPLGSLQNEHITSTSCSSTYTNIELQKNISLELPEENVLNEDQWNLRDTSFSSASIDFSNVLTTSTPKFNEQPKTSCTRASTGKRRRSMSTDNEEENNSIIITKKRKCENMAIQTSLISESDADDTMDWNQLKNNFFVGIPRIYKLCPCNDHSCRDK